MMHKMWRVRQLIVSTQKPLLLSLALFMQSCSAPMALLEPFIGGGGEEEAVVVSTDLSSDEWLDSSTTWRLWNSGLASNEMAQWAFEENAIEVSIVASDSLNLYEGAAHTVNIRFLQLTDPSALRTLSQTPGGVKTLLVEDLEMIPNAVILEGGLIAPGQVTTYAMPRQKDVMFFAIVVGFAELETKASVRLLPVPVLTIKAPEPEPSLIEKLSLGYLGGTEEVEPVADVIRPGKLKIKLTLGDSAISQVIAVAQ